MVFGKLECAPGHCAGVRGAVIAERIMSPKGGSGFQRLSGYVLNVAQEHCLTTDPASWTRLGAYILDTPHAGEKVAWSRATNCGHDDPGWAAKAILATQAQNTRASGDKSYHLVVSFPEGERPTRAQMEDIEDRLCGAIGFGAHQRISAVHQNTDNWHLHVAINKVHPTTLRNVTPFRDHFRLQEACVALEIQHGLIRVPHVLDPEQSREAQARGRAAAFESRHSGQSFLVWTQAHARTPMMAADSWAAVHQIAAALGLDVKLRGAGLVIGHASDSRLHVKASSVDRALSLKAMTDRLGPFLAREQHAGRDGVTTRYERPKPSGDLHEQFQRERGAALQARKTAAALLSAQHRDYAAKLASYYRDRMRDERARGQRGSLRREALRHIAEKRAEDRATRIAREKTERAQLTASHPVPSWQGWLESKAAAGNEWALAALRSRQLRVDRIERDVLTADNADTARHVVHQYMRPAIRRDGRVIYSVMDGGLVSDEARQVRVPQPTVAAAFLALSIAADRFGPRPLVVNGTDAFRAQIVAAAGVEGMAVRFADPALERLRVQARGIAHGTGQSRADRDGDRGR